MACARHTCHTKGRFLRLISARKTASNLHIPPGTLIFSARTIRSRIDSLQTATIEMVAAPSTNDICGSLRVADMVVVGCGVYAKDDKVRVLNVRTTIGNHGYIMAELEFSTQRATSWCLWRSQPHYNRRQSMCSMIAIPE
jgi:hypothetical protein